MFRLTLIASGLAVAVMAGCGDAGGASPGTTTGKLPSPTFAKTINLAPVSGTVAVELPAANSLIKLSAARQVPVGTVVDATRGVVRLTAATPAAAHFDSGDFQAGTFEILQDPAEHGVTELRIRDSKGASAACGTAAGPAMRVLGRLLGDANGLFRTRGEFSTSTVRGTNWGVRDRCDGTLTIVRRGVVVVTDFATHKNVTVRAGQTFLAKAR